MCVIIFSPNTGNRPSSKTLELCNKANPHGIGIVTQGSKDMFSVSKGVSLDYVKKTLRNTDGAIAIHFRYATVGGIEDELCHPFPCTTKAETWTDYEASDILMTNGTWLNWEQSYEVLRKLLKLPKLHGDISDTRAMSQVVGSSLSTSFLSNITDKHPQSTRVRSLYMSKCKKRTASFYGDWQNYEGCKFSNMRWQPSRFTARKHSFIPHKPSATQQDFSSWLGSRY